MNRQALRSTVRAALAMFLVACGSAGGGSGSGNAGADSSIAGDGAGGSGADDATSAGDAVDGGGEGGFLAPQPTVAVALTGGGAASGLPLAARVEAFVVDGRTLRLRISNTSPDTSSTIEGAPVLVGLGFNVAGSFPADCLRVEGVDGAQPALVATEGALSLCGGSPDGAPRFVLELGSEGAAPGVARAQTREVVLRIADDCPGDFAFSAEALLQAPRETAAGKLVQWAGSLDRVGDDGADAGCITGDGAPAPERTPIDAVWTNIVATSAEEVGQPSVATPMDTRAGSLDVRFNDRVDERGSPVAPDEPVAIATVRNGLGDILEQWHLNDPWPPATLGEDHCDTTTTYSNCYVLPSSENGAAGTLWVDMPGTVADSNVGFDDDGGRVTVEGRAGFAPTAGGKKQRTIQVRWEHPVGIDHARLNVRAQTDFNLDGSFGDDAFVTLYRARWSGSGEDLAAPPVTVVEETATSVTLEIDVDAARTYVRQVYGAP